jgi:hypothetical protein
MDDSPVGDDAGSIVTRLRVGQLGKSGSNSYKGQGIFVSCKGKQAGLGSTFNGYRGLFPLG